MQIGQKETLIEAKWYFVYIPSFCIFYTAGNVRHAGGFCFGLECNQRLHFYFVHSKDKVNEELVDFNGVYPIADIAENIELMKTYPRQLLSRLQNLMLWENTAAADAVN